MRSCIYVVRNPLALIITLAWHLPTLECSRCLDSYPQVECFGCHNNGHRLVQCPKQTAGFSFSQIEQKARKSVIPKNWILNRPRMFLHNRDLLENIQKLFTIECTSIAMLAHGGPTNKAICQGMAVCDTAQK